MVKSSNEQIMAELNKAIIEEMDKGYTDDIFEAATNVMAGIDVKVKDKDTCFKKREKWLFIFFLLVLLFLFLFFRLFK